MYLKVKYQSLRSSLKGFGQNFKVFVYVKINKRQNTRCFYPNLIGCFLKLKVLIKSGVFAKIFGFD